MQPLAETFKQNNETSLLLIDFPPFGKSEEPKNVWTVFDYKEFTKEIILKCKEKNNFKTITIVGHSFGGRIAILLEGEHFITNIVLISSAGIKHQPLKVKLKICAYKLLKKLKYKYLSKFGSSDYKNLSKKMKQTFQNIVNVDLRAFCKNFKTPCLIIAAEKDAETPLKTQKKLSKLIKNSKLVVLKNENHFGYLKNLNYVSYLIKIFCNFA